MTDSQKPAQKFFTPLQKAIAEGDAEAFARAKLLDSTQHEADTAGSDRSLPANQRHDFDPAANKHFSEKIYRFPDSFNALRRELDENYPTFFNEGWNGSNKSVGYMMANDGPSFVAAMNATFDLLVQFDSDNIDNICKVFLDAARVKRGLSRLNPGVRA